MKGKSKDTAAKVRISGPGVIHVRSSDLVKTKEVQRQIKTYQREETGTIPG